MIATDTPSTPCGDRSAASADADSSSVFAGFGAAKIQARHLQRLAVVYVRQSDPQQVLHHRESTELQYNLVQRAVELGWPRERVLVIDEDQGHTAQTAEGRIGFQRLLAEVGLDHVGLVLGFQMSRLARSCKDWHQLLELCAIFGTLLSDSDGLYDPADYNDRLLLGLKGTMSEAELHMMCQRLHQGRRNKARRGEFFNHVPIGYQLLSSGEAVMDTDEQVQTVVRLMFDKFDELGSCGAVLRYLVEHDVRLGVRRHDGPNRGQLEWRRPCQSTLLSMLHHPLYTGAYTHGRQRIDPRRKVPGRRSTGRTRVPMEEWDVLRKDDLPAYITWERYLANQERLEQNCARVASKGTPRQGAALLGGLLVCGRCGCRLMVGYSGQASRPRYKCQRNFQLYGAEKCQSLAAGPLDEFIGQQILSVLKPAVLKLSLAAVEDIQRQRQQLSQQWRQRLERAGYQAERAARQYHAVEPENRLVVRELERLWEETLDQQRELEEAYHRFQSEQPAELTADEREMIRSLSSDLPALWDAPETTPVDRQMIVRYLIERAVVDVQGESERVDLTLHWSGGFVSQHELIRPVRRYEQLSNYGDLLGRIAKLHAVGRASSEIAQQLNEEGFHPPGHRSNFTAAMVRRLLSRCGRSCPRSRRAGVDDHQRSSQWRLSDLARELDMSSSTLHNWVRRGWLHADQLPGARGRWILRVDDDELRRLRELRLFCQRSPGRSVPARLTIAKPQTES
jgi:DNA invertase Pin-like site-specific DNA recombinase